MPGPALSTYHVVTRLIPQQVSGFSSECILTSFDITYTPFPCCLVSHNPSPVWCLHLLPPCHPHPMAENGGGAVTHRLRNLAEAAGSLSSCRLSVEKRQVDLGLLTLWAPWISHGSLLSFQHPEAPGAGRAPGEVKQA